MKIVVCVKQITYTYARTGMAPENHFLAREDRIYRVNPYDEVAVEMALRAKESLGEGEVILLSLGPLIAEADLRRCLSLGADRLVQIDANHEGDPWGKSYFLARAAEDMGAHLILCGKESLDTQSGQMGAYIAHRLGLPFVSNVTSMRVLQGQRTVELKRRAGRGIREIIECFLPAVLSVDMGLEVRLPKSGDKRRALSAAIDRLSYGKEDLARVVSVRTFPPRPRPKRVFTPDSRLEAFDRIQQLLMGSRVQKKGMMLSGNAESQVGGIMSFLREHGFLRSREE
jgi:electron transfer flavoprotein beta subunit